MLSYFVPLIPYPYRGEHVACPVCGSRGAKPIARFDRRFKPLPTVLCDKCGLFYTNPMPTQQELTAYYQNAYRFDYQFALFKPAEKHVRRKANEAAARYQTLADYCDLSRPLCTLDFGCGAGELVRYFADRGHEAHGFEPGMLYASHAANQGFAEIRCGEWSDMDYAPNSFDIITSMHVVEHLRAPVPAIQRMAEWLKPEGILYLEVPDMQRAEFKGFEQFHFAHVLGFSSDNLVLAGEKASLGVVARVAPTSIIFSKSASKPAIDLAATVARNRTDYTQKTTLIAYLKFQAKRIYSLARR